MPVRLQMRSESFLKKEEMNETFVEAYMVFKVAILQARAEYSNIKRNIDTIICSMKEASKNGADILLLPECFITGYELPMTYKGLLDAAISEPFIRDGQE